MENDSLSTHSSFSSGITFYASQIPKKRLGDPVKFIPVIFISLVIFSIHFIYNYFHCLVLMNIFNQNKKPLPSDFSKGLFHFIFFNIIFCLLLISFILCIVVDPGQIPDTSEWNLNSKASPDSIIEKKRSGERRHCKWCLKYKPDRCHHCRVCRRCVLRMDHHCPWIYNCVGYFNHKYFILLLLYSAVGCNFVTFTMLETINRNVELEGAFISMFMLLFGEILSSFMGLLVTFFLLFHLWLEYNALSTIEFCEKTLRKSGVSSSVYDRGLYGNVKEVLGSNLLLWLVPVNWGIGNGLNFEKTRKGTLDPIEEVQESLLKDEKF